MTDDITMNMFGELDDDERNSDRMVVKILNHRVGTSDGWLHVGGHTVLCPGFKREPGLLKFMPDQDLPNKSGILIDYYNALIAIIEEPAEKVQSLEELTIVWAAKMVVHTDA